MEQVITPGIVENILSWVDQPILDPLEDVSDLEMIDYNRERKYCQADPKRKKEDLDTTILCTIEEHVIDTKRARLSDLLSTGLAISHATMDKAIFEAKKIQNLGKQISLLENQVKYYKAS
jgi:hypothetical protein